MSDTTETWQSGEASSKILLTPTLLNGRIICVGDEEKTTT